MWAKPSEADLKHEYFVEIELKGNNFFESEEAFLQAASEGNVLELDGYTDAAIRYRSHTRSKAQLLRLIKSYRSYPEFRNEDTIDNLYERIGRDMPMTMPIVLMFKESGEMRVLGGNTRLDVAFQLNKTPKVLVVQI
jgi:hypothetical protein